MAAEDMEEVEEGNSIPREDDQHYVVVEVRIRSGFASKLESCGIPHLQMIQLPEESGEEGVFQIAPVPTTNNRFRPCFSLASAVVELYWPQRRYKSLINWSTSIFFCDVTLTLSFQHEHVCLCTGRVFHHFGPDGQRDQDGAKEGKLQCT